MRAPPGQKAKNAPEVAPVCEFCYLREKYIRMAWHNDLGRAGEEAAARYLMFHDYSILARNWRVGHLEIDIVAQKQGVLVFVEVKTLADTSVAEPEEKVDDEKRRRTVQAAEAYVHYYNLDQAVRFDIISVVGRERPFTVRHIENAFEVPPTFVGPAW